MPFKMCEKRRLALPRFSLLCQSACIGYLGSLWTDFCRFCIGELHSNLAVKFRSH